MDGKWNTDMSLCPCSILLYWAHLVSLVTCCLNSASFKPASFSLLVVISSSLFITFSPLPLLSQFKSIFYMCSTELLQIVWERMCRSVLVYQSWTTLCLDYTNYTWYFVTNNCFCMCACTHRYIMFLFTIYRLTVLHWCNLRPIFSTVHANVQVLISHVHTTNKSHNLTIKCV